VSSPHARCVESVRAVALDRGLRLESDDALAPDAPVEETRALLDLLPEASLVCTHREVIERLFGGELTCEKGAVWLLERRDGRHHPVAYLPPPTSAVSDSAPAALLG
jgi:hypothetical protein